MNVEDLRYFCLSFQNVKENMPWTESRYENYVTFTIAGKWFCLLDLDNNFCNVKCDPSMISDLQDRYFGIQPAWHMNKTHWIKILLDSDVPRSEIENLVLSAYRLIVSSLSKSRRAELGLSDISL